MSANRLVIAWILRGGVLAMALAVSSFVVMQSSESAFTATTVNSANAFSAGTVAIVDDDTASAMFTVTNMKPGDSAVDCIVVTYEGTIANPAAVKLYSGNYTDSGDFADYLNVTVEEGTGGSFGSCGGFSATGTIVSSVVLSTFDTTYTNYATGAGAWDPSGTPESKTYRFTIELDGGTPDAEQGESVSALVFTWEVQSD